MQTRDEHVENHERFLRDCLNKKAEVVYEACDHSLDEVCEKQVDIGFRTETLSRYAIRSINLTCSCQL